MNWFHAGKSQPSEDLGHAQYIGFQAGKMVKGSDMENRYMDNLDWIFYDFIEVFQRKK